MAVYEHLACALLRYIKGERMEWILERGDNTKVDLFALGVFVISGCDDHAIFRAWIFPCYFRILRLASGAKCGNNTEKLLIMPSWCSGWP